MIGCFGEIMLRLSPDPDSNLIEQALNFRIVPGGSESNVAIALSGLGNKTTMITVLPKNVLGRKVLRYLKWHNVDTERIILHDLGRMGLYFTEKGSGNRGSRVLYDRENSSYNHMNKLVKNIDNLLKKCSWLHLSGIALATSRTAADFALIITKKAKEKRIKVSFDINDRNLLWCWCKTKSEKYKYLKKVAECSTILIGNETDFEVGLFGNPKLNQKDLIKKLSDIAQKKKLEWVAISQREAESADINSFGGVLYDFSKDLNKPKKYSVAPQVITGIVDRIGSGDAFCAGILDGFIKIINPEDALIRAVKLGILKHGIYGDACMVDSDLLEECLLNKNGRIIR
jgi:2-dehydro-3-deoxygluconokinase